MPITAAIKQSDHAGSIVEQGQELAEVFDLELHVVNVQSVAGTEVEQGKKELEVEENAARERAHNVAEEAVDNIDNTEKYSIVGLVGEPAQEIIKYSSDCDAKYIVAGGRKRTPVGKALFGSTTQSILLNANRAVVTVPSEHR